MTRKSFIIIALAGMFFCAGFTGTSIAQENETVYIGMGEHYDLGPYYSWGEADLWVNMTVIQGGNVDVYVMNMNQYYNAYPFEEEPGGISFQGSSQENVSQANIYIHIEMDNEQELWEGEEVWIIIDNRDVSATPNDAIPTGNVQVELEIVWESDEYDYYDDFFWMEGLICMATSVIPVVLIVLLLFLIYRKMDKKKETQPPMNYYQNPQVAPQQGPIMPAQTPEQVSPEPSIPPPIGETSQEPVPPEEQ